MRHYFKTVYYITICFFSFSSSIKSLRGIDTFILTDFCSDCKKNRPSYEER